MEIKFRGKCMSGKYEDESIYLKWIYGDLHHIGDEYYIYADDGMWHEVDEKTVGQYIGFRDKNGVEIYVGDVIAQNEFLFLIAPIGTICEGIYSICVFDDKGRTYPFDNSVSDGNIIENIYDAPNEVKNEFKDSVNHFS